MVKYVVQQICPPIIIKLVKKIINSFIKNNFEYEVIQDGWNASTNNPKIKGWNVETVLTQYQQKWSSFLQCIEAPAVLGTSPEAKDTNSFDLIYHNTLMVFAYCLALATRNKKNIKMLDWGGGIGHYYHLARSLIPDLEINYYCKDVPILVEHGKKIMPGARFFSDEQCLKDSFDFILVSASLHYDEYWESTLNKLSQSVNGHILITRLPVVLRGPSYVFVQRPYQYGYDTEYISWAISRQDFLNCAKKSGLRLIREFVTGERPLINKASEPCEYRAYLFASEGDSYGF